MPQRPYVPYAGEVPAWAQARPPTPAPVAAPPPSAVNTLTPTMGAMGPPAPSPVPLSAPAFGAGGGTADLGAVFDDPMYDEYRRARQSGIDLFAPPAPSGGNPYLPEGMGPDGAGPAPMMPGMMGAGLPDPGEEAMEREDAFASLFPRALEAMNRLGIYKGGSDSAQRPTGLGAASRPTAPNTMMRGGY